MIIRGAIERTLKIEINNIGNVLLKNILRFNFILSSHTECFFIYNSFYYN